jgi:GTP-binding protein EngB required for normal cell division
MDGRRAEVADVAARLTALESALGAGEPWLDPVIVEQARISVVRADTRIQLGADHTVVALAGATGTGKSSLFNALARMEIAQVGARRPTTSLPMACIWGEGGSEELLDWLEVPEHQRITRESVLDADLQAPLLGLVLLDLPDNDSTEVVHRFEVDRLVTMVDLLVWVVDPQKYADAALHSGYLKGLVGHDGVMVVVLNQIDRLEPDEAASCVQDLRRLLDADGLTAVPLIPISAQRGDGVDDLRTLLAEVVQDRTAIPARIGADLQLAIDMVATGMAKGEPGDGGTPPGADRLVEELAVAAGVPAVLDAVAAEYRRRGRIRAQWPVLIGVRRLLPDRLTRLGNAVDQQDLKLITSGLTPVSAPSQRPRVELAVEAVVATNASPLPPRWADAVREAVARPGDDLVGVLDAGVAAVDLELSPPPWWWLVTVAQYLLAVAAAVGALWLVLLGAGHMFYTEPLPSTSVLGQPLALVLLVGGLLGGALLTGLSNWVLAVGARRRRFAAREELFNAVQAVAEERVIAPIRIVLDQHRATRLSLEGRPLDLAHRPEPGSRRRASTKKSRRSVAGGKRRRAAAASAASGEEGSPFFEVPVVGVVAVEGGTAVTGSVPIDRVEPDSRRLTV